MSVKDKIKHPFYSLTNSNGMNEGTTTKLRNASRSDSNFVYAMLESSEAGITKLTSDDRLKKYGPNEVQHDKAPSWLNQLFKAFINPFIFILLVIAAISFIVDIWMAAPGEADFKTVIMVAVMVLFSALLRFFQEFRSNRAADKLKSMVKTTATVLRKFIGKREIAMTELVPGDILYLSAGDMVPADCRIMQSKDLFVSESMLTGEALPVEKTFLPIRDADTKQPIELHNLCFMGTNVVRDRKSVV